MPSAPPPSPDDDSTPARVGERLRRYALGLTAALIAARADWPSEPDFTADAGRGLEWCLAVLLVTGLALAAALVGGALRFRWSWADASVVALTTLLGLSVRQALDVRPAINLAWEGASVGLLFLLVRGLPRSRSESRALAAVLAATAAAVAGYGIYQTYVELPAIHARFASNPAFREHALRVAGIAPGTPSEALYIDRLLSSDAYSTFTLPASLAGYLVGPLVVVLAVAWDELRRSGRRGERRTDESASPPATEPGPGGPLALALSLLPILLMAVGLLVTKSRSAYLGLAAGVGVVMLHSWKRVRARTLALTAAALVLLAGGLVAGVLSTGRLDTLVLTESSKSLRYRWEYWVGTWRAIAESPRAFWLGYGPGNLLAPYLRHKLPGSSEEIKDPHNLVLEAWATAGAAAALALLAALGLTFWNTLGPARPPSGLVPDDPPAPDRRAARRRKAARASDAGPESSAWLVAAGAGGLLLVFVVGRFNLFEGDMLTRRPILLGGWLAAMGCLLPLWRRGDVPAVGLGRRFSGRRGQPAGGRRHRRLVGRLDARGARRPGIEPARRPAVRPGPPGGRPTRNLRAAGRVGRAGGHVRGVGGALLEGRGGAGRGPRGGRARAPRPPAAGLRPGAGPVRAGRRGRQVQRPPVGGHRRRAVRRLGRARVPPRRPALAGRPDRAGDGRQGAAEPRLLALHRRRAEFSRELLRRLGPGLPSADRLRLQGDVVHATRTASRLYPSNATLHAELAEASAAIGMTADAAREVREALRLDRLTPHLDKKLPDALRRRLDTSLIEWEKAPTPAGPPPAAGPS